MSWILQGKRTRELRLPFAFGLAEPAGLLFRFAKKSTAITMAGRRLACNTSPRDQGIRIRRLDWSFALFLPR